MGEEEDEEKEKPIKKVKDRTVIFTRILSLLWLGIVMGVVLYLQDESTGRYGLTVLRKNHV